ncbi:MAG: flavin reductase family protein [Actinobacteria bacterium]|nr:flavin reductase family protein [Actinomycetota bacterium]
MIQPPDEAFRTVISRFASGVTVVTTLIDGEPHGMTASAVSSLSLDPLLVLVCVERDTALSELAPERDGFALSVLTASQVELSDRFADPDRPAGEAQFVGLGTRPAATGAPILPDVLAWIDCRVWARYDGGDHVILVGEVVDMGLGGQEDPLIHFRGSYTTAVRPPDPDR